MPATTRSKADPKIQAKLDFTPVSKDSLQAQQLAASVRSRASAVRYISPKKARLSRNASKKSIGDAKQQRPQLSYPETRIHGSQPWSSPGIGSWLRRRDGTSPVQDVNLPLTSPLRTTRTRRFDRPLYQARSPKDGPENSGENVEANSAAPDGLDVELVDDTDDSEPDMVLSSARIQTRKTVFESDSEDDLDLPVPAYGNNVASESPDKDDNENEEEEDTLSEDEPVVPSSTRNPRHSRGLILVSDDEEEPVSSSTRASKRSRLNSTQASSSPSKRRRLQNGPKPRKMTREERDEEVLEDAQDLQDTETLHQGLRSASKLSEKKLARQRQLSKLAARRRSKGAITIDSSSPSPDPEELLPTPYNDIYSDDNSSQADSLIDDDIDALSTTSSTSEIRINRSIYDVPSALYYTIQELLHQKLHPSHQTPGPAHELANYFTTATSLIDKRLESYANQFISSIWRKDFTTALHARPTITWPRNELTIWESCEACGRRDHPARYVMRFEGRCYDEQTLAAVEDETSPVFARFHIHVPEDAVWHVGADCHDKAWRAHRATHWRFGLAVQVDKALAMMGVEISGPSNSTADPGIPNENVDADDENQDTEWNDHYQAVLLQLEEQGYIQALQREFLERFEMVNDEDEDDD